MPETTAVTSTEVFQFMKSKSDEVTTNTSFIVALIGEQQDVLERRIGRKLQKNTLSSEVFQNGINCEINPNFTHIMILKSKLRDLYSITSLYENDVLLTSATSYNDNKDYYFDINKGILIRLNGNWSNEALAFKITGSYGLVVSSTTETTRPDLKYALIEMVAASSGLWLDYYIADGVRVDKIQDRISKKAEAIIKRYEGVII